MRRGLYRVTAAVGIAILFVGLTLTAAFFLNPRQPVGPGPSPNEGASFVFAAVGDLGGPGVEDMLSLAKRTNADGADFLVALGDLGYTSDEDIWCRDIKSGINDVEVIGGNHDVGESSGGDMASYVVECPFTLGVPVTGGPGTPGYGYEYYFDFPSTTPLARFILISAGLQGNLNYDYSAGSTHFNWVVDAVNDARARSIPWVFVAMHKLCINAGWYGCEMGQDLFDKLVDLRVDLILGGHYHTYQRSKQLALSAACPTVPAEDKFDADCIVDDGADDNYTKGAGSLVLINGAGGNSLYDIAFDGSDPEINYMAQAMGSNQNSRGLSEGYGPALFTVTSTSIVSRTDFCAPGSTDASGQCPSAASSTFWDRFTIGTPPPGPVAVFSYNPTTPQPDQLVTFDAGASYDSDPGATLQARWDWEDDGTWDTSLSSTLTAQHAFAAGTHTVRLEIQDSNAKAASTTRQVVVQSVAADTTPPVTASSVSGTHGSGNWYTSDVSVTLTATDSGSGVAVVSYRLDGGGWTAYADPVSVSGDGSHTLEYYAADVAGNNEAAKSVGLSIDATPPSSSASLSGTQDPGGSYLASASVSLTSWDATSGVSATHYQIDGGSLRTYASPFAVSGNGSHTVTYFATDTAGNDEGTKSVSFRVSGSNQSAPVTSLALSGTSGENGWYRSPVTVTLTAAGGSGPITTEYRVDGGAWGVYAAPFVVGEGQHTVDYQSSDDAGYVEPAKSSAVDVDETRPEFQAASPSGTLTTSEVTVVWYASDALSGVAEYLISIDGGAFTPLGTDTSLDRVWTDGDHSVVVRAVDAAGNEALETIDFRVQTGLFGQIDLVEWLPLLMAPAALLGFLALAIHLRRRRADTEYN